MDTQRLRRIGKCLALALVTLISSSVAFAQDLSLKPEHVPPDSAPREAPAEPTTSPVEEEPNYANAPKGKSYSMWRNVGLGAAGVATAFVVHETGHVLFNFMFGNVPTLSKTSFGPFPFFTIDPEIFCTDMGCFKKDGSRFKAGRTGKYLITAGGFIVQNAATEWMLTRNPKMRYRYAPFQKGFLLFTTALSFGYALSAWARIEPPTGDLDGMAGASQIPKDVIALLVALPAALDLMRFMRPDWKWTPWVSRSSKIVLVGVAFTFPP